MLIMLPEMYLSPSFQEIQSNQHLWADTVKYKNENTTEMNFY